MLELASVGIVTLHLLAADVAAVGPLVCLWFQWRGARGDRLAAAVGRHLMVASIAGLVAAMVLGAAALGMLWMLGRESWFTAARQLPAARYWFGLIEVFFSLACMIVVARLDRGEHRPGFHGRFTARFILSALAGTNLAYHFPTLFSAIAVLSTRPQAWGQKIKFIQLLADPEVFARTLHHLLAALVVTGGAIMIGSLRWRFDGIEAEREEGEETGGEETGAAANRRRAAIWGGRIALAASVAQMLAGMHLLFQLPAASRQGVMGEDMAASLLFGVALLTTVMLLHRLAAISFGDAPPRQLVAAALLIFLTMLLMTATARRTRWAASPPAGRAACGPWGAEGKLMARRLPPQRRLLGEKTRTV